MPQSHLDSDDAVGESLGVPQDLSRPRRLYTNLGAFLSRFFALACEPRGFAPLVVDYWLLIQSAWTGRQLGPDVVYPILGIRKRQSGRLASLILEHCRDEWSYELHVEATFPQGIEPPCVAVIDLDDVHWDAVENSCSTQVDLYGLAILMMLFETIVTLIMHVYYLWDLGWFARVNLAYGAMFNLTFCLYAVLRGDGILTLARRSDTSTPGCAMLLDQDFTVVLNGRQSVVEAIAESSFNLSHPNSVWRLRLNGEYHGGGSFYYDLLEVFCEAACLVVFVLCWLVFRPSTTQWIIGPIIIMIVMNATLQKSPPDHYTWLQEIWFLIRGSFLRIVPPLVFLSLYEQAWIEDSSFSVDWQSSLHHFLAIILIVLCSAGYRDRNYPIRSAKFLDALGHPCVRKWQFDTLAAAATFQCLVICHGIARPIRSIDVLALLDMLVPDQRDVWKAWKERVADRIVHESDILFAPTIPTFGDERQQQLKGLLDQAQWGDYAYRDFYA